MKELACFGESEQELNFALSGPVDHYGGSTKPNHLMKDTFYSMHEGLSLKYFDNRNYSKPPSVLKSAKSSKIDNEKR